MELYESFSILIVLSAIFSYLNERFLKLPSTIGVMVIALLVSLGLILTDKLLPHIFQEFSTFISSVDFTEVLMGAMLNFLLFAGAIHIRLNDLKEQKAPIMIFSTVSVILSTFAVGFMLFYLLRLFHQEIPMIQCLLFGALISPTDPVAVLGILKQAGVPKSVETKVAGESLFNDGIAVVVFIILLRLAQGEEVDLSFESISGLLAKEALGGVALGLLMGYIASKAIGRIDNYKIEVLITLSVVMGGHLVAQAVHMSGPLAMVAAGLVIGNYGRSYALSEVSKDYLDKFWELVDEIMNAILFLIIGFELILITNIGNYWFIGLASIAIVLLARWFSIWLPVKIIPMKTRFNKTTITILVWGGLRGGVSVALALSIDNELNKDLLLSITYYVVLFSILVQGLTIGKLTGKAKQKAAALSEA